MSLTSYLPFSQARKPAKKAEPLNADDESKIQAALKPLALALGFHTTLTSISTRSTFESAPYDFERIIQCIDTDSYAKQAFAKYRELFWKEGWDIVSENPEAVDYLYQRIDFMEIAMKRPFQHFLADVADNLVKFHNVFIVKARGDLKRYFPGKLRAPEGLDPIIGYYIIPTEKVEIQRDKYNRPIRYRQRIDDASASWTGDDENFPTWAAEDVIHLYYDRKAGRQFGTPFMTAAVDDIVALRQIEEDIQNLVHRELFPLYKYTVGDDDHPASKEEIESAQMELEGLRTEGGLVIPHRHDIDIIGAQNKALDASGYLDHFMVRVAMGLGVFPHHLGMVNFGGGNRSMTDRLDSALYDKIKSYQAYFADAIRLLLFNELLREGGYDPIVNPKLEGVQDRCQLVFREIDLDTQIKKETHSIQKASTNLETVGESRLAMGLSPEIDEADTLAAMQVRLQPTTQIVSSKSESGATKSEVVDTTPEDAVKNGKQTPSKGGSPNAKNLKKGPANIIRPTNQQGTRTSPNVRHSDVVDDMWTEDLLGILDKE